MSGPGLARKLNDCRTCHAPVEDGTDADDSRPHNAFGKRLKGVRATLKKAGKASGIADRIKAIADEDSDGDGVANLLEVVTGHFPGEADDRPAEVELAAGRRAIAALKLARNGYPWNPFERVARPEVPPVRSRPLGPQPDRLTLSWPITRTRGLEHRQPGADGRYSSAAIWT